jgi:hypothetical protein
MRSRLVTAALLSAGLVTTSAHAAETIDPNIVPALRLGLSFGGAPSQKDVVSLALQFQYRGVYALRRPDPQVERFELAPLSIETVALKADRSGLRAALVMSHDLLEDHRLAQNGETSGSNWVWWMIGGIAVTAGTVLAVAGAAGDAVENDVGPSGDPPSGGDPSDPEGCNIIGGEDVTGGQVYVTRGCEGVPDVP